MTRRLLLLAVASLTFTGCGSATGSSLEDAAEATAAETSRFEMSFEIANPEREAENFNLEAEGVFDYPNERGLMTVSGKLPFLADDLAMKEFRLLGVSGYTRWVVKGKSYWVKEEEVESSDDPTELLIPFPGSPTNPTDVLTRVLLASEENEEVGADDVRGTETTHYRARVDLRKLVTQLPAAQRPEGEVEELWGARFVPVEIWIDDESRLRRITIRQSGKDENGTTETRTTVELFDYGVEVDVQPPDGEVISQEEFDRLTSYGEGWTSSDSGEGEPLESPEQVCEWARDELPNKDAEEVCADAKAAAKKEKE
jgi:hypothetical protein